MPIGGDEGRDGPMTPPERPEGPEDPRMAEFERLVDRHPVTTNSSPVSTSVTPSEEGGADVHDRLDP